MIYLSAWIDQHASIISSQNQSVVVTCGHLGLEMTPNEQQVSVCYDQWRVCFIWDDGDVDDIEIVDYHG
jgi:plasmid maintenance system killer protein